MPSDPIKYKWTKLEIELFSLRDCLINPISHGGGRILPMAWKFRNSSNSEEFGALALLDFSPFVITKP